MKKLGKTRNTTKISGTNKRKKNERKAKENNTTHKNEFGLESGCGGALLLNATNTNSATGVDIRTTINLTNSCVGLGLKNELDSAARCAGPG